MNMAQSEAEEQNNIQLHPPPPHKKAFGDRSQQELGRSGWPRSLTQKAMGVTMGEVILPGLRLYPGCVVVKSSQLK